MERSIFQIEVSGNETSRYEGRTKRKSRHAGGRHEAEQAATAFPFEGAYDSVEHELGAASAAPAEPLADADRVAFADDAHCPRPLIHIFYAAAIVFSRDEGEYDEDDNDDDDRVRRPEVRAPLRLLSDSIAVRRPTPPQSPPTSTSSE